MNEPTLKFIGSVQSPLKNLEDCPLQEHEEAPQASIIIFPEFAYFRILAVKIA